MKISVDIVPCIKFRKSDDDLNLPDFNPYFETTISNKSQRECSSKSHNKSDANKANNKRKPKENNSTLCLKHGIGIDVLQQMICFYSILIEWPVEVKRFMAFFFPLRCEQIIYTPMEGCDNSTFCQKLLTLGVKPHLNPQSQRKMDLDATHGTKNKTQQWINISHGVIDDLYLVCPYSQDKLYLNDSILVEDNTECTLPFVLFDDFLKCETPSCHWRLSTSLLEKQVFDSLDDCEKRPLRIVKYLFQSFKQYTWKQSKQKLTNKCKKQTAERIPSYVITSVYLRTIMFLTKHNPELKDYLKNNTYVWVKVLMDILMFLVGQSYSGWRDGALRQPINLFKNAIFENSYTLDIPRNMLETCQTCNLYLSSMIQKRTIALHHICLKQCTFCISPYFESLYGCFKNKPNIIYSFLDINNSHIDEGKLMNLNTGSFAIECSYYRVIAAFDKQEYLLLRNPRNICDMHRYIFLLKVLIVIPSC